MKRNRVFWVALTVSALFHLSMVTLFQIVILFPREDIHYFEVSIVEAAPLETRVARGPREELRLSSPDDAFDRLSTNSGLDPVERFAGATLPQIELPTIEFAGQDLLRIRTEGLEIRSQYQELFLEEPRDTWERFWRGLSTLGDALSRVTVGRIVGEDEPRPISQPAPGFEAFVEWMDGPGDRLAVAVSRVEKLWGHDPGLLREPIILMFRVNAEGKVTSILPQMEDDAGLVQSAIEALFKYRFEPLRGDETGIQNGALVIRAARDRR